LPDFWPKAPGREFANSITVESTPGGEGRAPHECRRWWFEDGTLFVDRGRVPGLFEFQTRSTTVAKMSKFNVQKYDFMYVIQNNAPVALRRNSEPDRILVVPLGDKPAASDPTRRRFSRVFPSPLTPLR
jgi:hypothetical protein